jgi:hypothetical protein
MANKQKGEVVFEADGKAYTLTYSINALCELESAFDGTVTDIFAATSGKKRFTTLRTVFWAGLTDHHPGLSLVDAGKIMHALGLNKADAVAGEAFRLAFPERKEDQDGPLAKA